MPYGPWCILVPQVALGFNPSYGLHALRAGKGVCFGPREAVVSIPHMGCMPYGLLYRLHLDGAQRMFQSLIWVACPTGWLTNHRSASTRKFQSLIWVACPTGQRRSLALPAALAGAPVSIPHMGCMPYGRRDPLSVEQKYRSFNPSYGLHALRAQGSRRVGSQVGGVSIPHMGCMPYGRGR